MAEIQNPVLREIFGAARDIATPFAQKYVAKAAGMSDQERADALIEDRIYYNRLNGSGAPDADAARTAPSTNTEALFGNPLSRVFGMFSGTQGMIYLALIVLGIALIWMANRRRR